MNNNKTINSLETNYKRLSGTINVLFILGYIIDFCIRRGFFSEELTFLSILPFTTNIILALIAFAVIKDLGGYRNIKKQIASLTIRVLMNLAFIMIILLI